MARDHYMTPVVPDAAAKVVRLGAGNLEANRWDFKEQGKLVKLVAESRYDLCAAGDAIEGVVYAVELAPQNGYTIGSVVSAPETRIYAVADGLQATPGTGAVAVGDYVVAGTATAKGTALTTYPKVCKATSQTPGAFAWRVVSLGTVGTGAVGTQIVIERV